LHLSPLQMQRVEEAMRRAVEMQAPAAPAAPRTFSLPVGAKIEIKRWLANRMAEKLKLTIFFRNLEVMEVLDETVKAYKVSIRFVSTVANSCHCCGKDLDTEISRASGIGPVCAKKYFQIKRPSVETAGEILATLDKYCLEVGTIREVWIPKSQMVGVFGQAHAPDAPIRASREVAEMVGAQEPTANEIWQRVKNG